MKKLAFIAVLVSLVVFKSNAQEQKENKVATQTVAKSGKMHSNFVDNNKDGKCDNYEVNHKDGVKHGNNFTDVNKDGVCDNHKTETTCRHGKGHGRGHGNGNGYQHRHGMKD